MPPVDPFSPTVAAQAAVERLLLTYEPGFLAIGSTLFSTLATVLLAWHGIQMMFTQQGLGDKIFHFAKLLLVLSFGYAMIFYYERPIPGFGVSFSNLITDQAITLANIIDTRAMSNIQHHLDDLLHRFEKPDAWAVLATLLYVVMLFVIGVTKMVAIAAVCYGLIASAVCALLGPLFVPFFVVPGLDWLFWGWLKSFIAYSFMQVVAYAYIFAFERFIFQYLTTLPAYIPQDDYTIYIVHVLMVLFTFAFGAVLIPSLTASILSGRSGESALPSFSSLTSVATGGGRGRS